MIVVRCCFSALLLLIGLASLAQSIVGISCLYVQTDLVMLNNLLDSFLFTILWIFIGSGFVSLLFAFVSIRQKKSVVVLWIFVTALNLLVLLLTVVYQTTIWPKFDRALIRSLHEKPLETSNFLDHFQEKYSCCGISGKIDYEKLPLDPLPSSCCRLPNCWRDADINRHIVAATPNVSLMHSTGCSSSMAKFLRTELSVLLGVAAFCSLFDLLLVVLLFSVRVE